METIPYTYTQHCHKRISIIIQHNLIEKLLVRKRKNKHGGRSMTAMEDCLGPECNNISGTHSNNTLSAKDLGLATGFAGLGIVCIIICTLTLVLVLCKWKHTRSHDRDSLPRVTSPLNFTPPTPSSREYEHITSQANEKATSHEYETFKFESPDQHETHSSTDTRHSKRRPNTLPRGGKKAHKSTSGESSSSATAQTGSSQESSVKLQIISSTPQQTHPKNYREDIFDMTESAGNTETVRLAITPQYDTISTRPPLQTPRSKSGEWDASSNTWSPVSLTPVTALREHTSFRRMLPPTQEESQLLTSDSGGYVNEGMGPKT